MKVFLLLLVLTSLAVMCGCQMAEPEIHLIPPGFMGNIYIFHNVPDGQPPKYDGSARIYEIPKDGILRSQTLMNPGWQSTPQYFYVTSDGKREKISGYWRAAFTTRPKIALTKRSEYSFPERATYQG
jgi:hypothetical protein